MKGQKLLLFVSADSLMVAYFLINLIFLNCTLDYFSFWVIPVASIGVSS